jgi:translation initiation factor IF-1
MAGAASVWASPPPFSAVIFRRFSKVFFIISMEEHIEIEGRILTVLAGTMFRVELDNKHQVLATISGKMRKKFVRLTSGDRVKMEMSPYDLNKARIVWRIG